MAMVDVDPCLASRLVYAARVWRKNYACSFEIPWASTSGAFPNIWVLLSRNLVSVHTLLNFDKAATSSGSIWPFASISSSPGLLRILAITDAISSLLDFNPLFCFYSRSLTRKLVKKEVGRSSAPDTWRGKISAGRWSHLRISSDLVSDASMSL
jgi:hypothetical protein